MKIILHEIELNGADVESSRDFYQGLGLPVCVDQEGLKVFDSGWSGMDLNVSTHNPGRLSISFLVDDLDAFVQLREGKGQPVGDIYSTHLGMRAVEFYDPDGNRIEIQSPTEESPQFLHDMLK